VVASFRDHVAQSVNVAEHFLKAVGGTLEFRSITFALETVHCLLDHVEQVKELGNSPTQLGCVGSSWRRCKHAEKMGAKGLCFKPSNMTAS
jgi:hypothetical protein